jgi:hypothetical protein
VINMTEKIARWLDLRQQIAELDRASHPDITDRYGRVWVWSSGDLYVHDETIAISRDWIASWGLPARGLADRNPNYAKLCGICRHEAAA